MSVTTAGICLAVFTILGTDMVSHCLTAIMPMSHLMDAFSLADGIGKTGYCTLQWEQPQHKRKENSQ